MSIERGGRAAAVSGPLSGLEDGSVANRTRERAAKESDPFVPSSKESSHLLAARRRRGERSLGMVAKSEKRGKGCPYGNRGK